MRLYYLNDIPTEWSEEEDRLLEYVSEERRRRIGMYRFDSDRLLSLYSALLVRYGLYTLTGYKGELTFTSKMNFKPYCNELKNIDFSFSHTENVVLCGLSSSGRIGVDVEIISEAPYDIMNIVFNDAEIDYINTGGKEKNQRFYEIWTSKEAYTKCIGIGLVTDITSINMYEKNTDKKLKVWKKDNHICSVCCENDQEYILKDVGCKTIINYLKLKNKV